MAFFYIKSQQDLKLTEKLARAPVIGLDLETAGSNGLIPQQSRIRLLQLASAEDCFVLDLDHLKSIEPLRPILCSRESVKVMHHAKFDIKHLLYHFNLEVGQPFCTMLASQLLARGQRFQRHGLAEVVRRFLGVKLDKSLQTSAWEGALSEAQIQYAAADAEILPELHEVLAEGLKKFKLNRVSQLEFRTVVPVAAMELRGMYVDRERLEEVLHRLEKRCALLECQVLEQLQASGALPGMNILNLHAPEQVKQALQDRGIAVTDTSDRQLRPLVEPYPFIGKLLEFRHLSKIVSGTLKQLGEHILPETQRIHSNYHQIASASGRFACSEPNVQQVPRERWVRACFRPQAGYRYVIADYSQVELRVAAGLSRDPIMLKAYGQGGDLHRLTAALTLGKQVEEVSKEERQAAKAINFGLIYAMGPKGLQQSAKASYGVELSLEEAGLFRRRFFANYRGIKNWQQQLEREGMQRRYVRTAAGRIRAYGNEEIRVTELFNIPVQGTAAEGLKSALCIFWDRVKQERVDASVVAIIHDEIIVEVAVESAEKVRIMLQESMVEGISWLVPGVPFEAEAAIAESWAEK